MSSEVHVLSGGLGAVGLGVSETGATVEEGCAATADGVLGDAVPFVVPLVAELPALDVPEEDSPSLFVPPFVSGDFTAFGF